MTEIRSARENRRTCNVVTSRRLPGKPKFDLISHRFREPRDVAPVDRHTSRPPTLCKRAPTVENLVVGRQRPNVPKNDRGGRRNSGWGVVNGEVGGGRKRKEEKKKRKKTVRGGEENARDPARG